jgi:A/G-specific adenine glycosylase
MGEDPSVRSAGVSTRQARFDGSDRQARGLLMKALAAGPVRYDRVATVMACDGRRAERLADDLQREGLIVRTGHEVLLP